MIQKIVTENSIWVFDSDSMMVTRIPKTEDISHPGLQYQDVGKPRSFETAKAMDAGTLDMDEKRILVDDYIYTGYTKDEFVNIGV